MKPDTKVKVTTNSKGKEKVIIQAPKNDLPMFFPVYAIDYSDGPGKPAKFKYIGLADTDQLKNFKKLLKPKVEK